MRSEKPINHFGMEGVFYIEKCSRSPGGFARSPRSVATMSEDIQLTLPVSADVFQRKILDPHHQFNVTVPASINNLGPAEINGCNEVYSTF